MRMVSKSAPMVYFSFWLNSLRVKRKRRLDLPTPVSPINITRGSERREQEENGITT